MESEREKDFWEMSSRAIVIKWIEKSTQQRNALRDCVNRAQFNWIGINIFQMM